MRASLEHGGPSLFAEWHFLLAKILNTQAVVTLGAKDTHTSSRSSEPTPCKTV